MRVLYDLQYYCAICAVNIAKDDPIQIRYKAGNGAPMHIECRQQLRGKSHNTRENSARNRRRIKRESRGRNSLVGRWVQG